MRIALVVIGFLGAGLIGAIASHELFPAPTASEQSPSEYAALEVRVADLAGRVERLTEEIRARRDADVVPVAPPPLESMGGPDPVPTAAPDSLVPAPALTDDRIEQKVTETIEKIARERRLEKARQVELETRKKEREWLLQKQKELGFTDHQVDEFAKLLIYRRERYVPLKAGWDEATPEEQARRKAEMEDLGRELRGELRKLLSAEQYESVLRTNGKK